MPTTMLKVNGTFYQSSISISICPGNKENFINVDIAKQLPFPEANIAMKDNNEDANKKLRLTDQLL